MRLYVELELSDLIRLEITPIYVRVTFCAKIATGSLKSKFCPPET